MKPAENGRKGPYQPGQPNCPVTDEEYKARRELLRQQAQYLKRRMGGKPCRGVTQTGEQQQRMNFIKKMADKYVA